jgi:hypothetical protein
MLPIDLKPEQFNGYAPEAKRLVINNLPALRLLPLSFLPSLLREAIDLDFKFPAERKALGRELSNLSSLSDAQLKEWFQSFAQIELSAQLESFDWVNLPAQFVEQLSAYLWTTHQLDAFRVAALAYAQRLGTAVPPDPPVMPRLGLTIIGQGVTASEEPLFRKLRPHGVYFSRVQPENGLQQLLEAAASRAKSRSMPYGHWYIDGGQSAPHDAALTSVSYHALEPARAALSNKIRTEIERPGMGPEALRTVLAQLRPADLGMDSGAARGADGKSALSGDAVLDRFQVKLLTEGSGTQVFSTTFAQWAAREALRRAQPLTLLVRFAPRQRQKPMNEMLAGSDSHLELDPLGSLTDANNGAYYNWLNQQRLTGAEQSSFLVWFENHSNAVAIGPAMPSGTESTTSTDLKTLLSWMG